MIQNRSTITSAFTPLTNKSLSLLEFTANDIKSIISKLDPEKVRGHDTVSTRMVKLCRDSIYKPLEMIIQCCLNQGTFPVE